MPDPCGTSYFLFFCSWPGHFKTSKRPAFAFMAVCCVLLLTKKLLCPVHNIQPTSIMRRSAVFKNRQRSYYSPISFMHILFCCCIRRNLYGYTPPDTSETIFQFSSFTSEIRTPFRFLYSARYGLNPPAAAVSPLIPELPSSGGVNDPFIPDLGPRRRGLPGLCSPWRHYLRYLLPHR